MFKKSDIIHNEFNISFDRLTIPQTALDHVSDFSNFENLFHIIKYQNVIKNKTDAIMFFTGVILTPAKTI